jgi:glutathione peroxidase
LIQKLSLSLFLGALFLSGGPGKPPTTAKVDIYSFNLPDIKGKLLPFEQFKDKVLLIVNVASNSGFTPQYAGLEELYEKHKAEGLVVLGFPSNDFGAEEPESEAKIEAFCQSAYHVTFPLFSKVAVRGDEITALFSYLTKEANPKLKGDVHWNFSKFLLDRKGKLVSRFSPDVTPDDPDLMVAIENALKRAGEAPTQQTPPEQPKASQERRPPGGA